MSPRGLPSFDAETVRQLEDILERAWESLPSERREHTTKSHVAQRILRLAAEGERDPAQLHAYAVQIQSTD
jgi:hypothetical protein